MFKLEKTKPLEKEKKKRKEKNAVNSRYFKQTLACKKTQYNKLSPGLVSLDELPYDSDDQSKERDL